MNILVTGIAGFIGSHIAERLLALDHAVIGIDCFTDYYPRELKQKNIDTLLKGKNFKFIEGDLLKIDLKKLLKDVDVIFHQAAQAGVRASWGINFEIYTKNNILATQMLLEAAKEIPLKKFIYASSSSVYGNTRDLPTREDNLLQPVSPYGVTKLAAENLCMLYHINYKVPVTCLRYFTVYGPRQRPDMAFNKFIKAIIKDQEIIVYGDGSQTRDFTYISDAVEANLLAMGSNVVGEIFNIGGGSNIALSEVIKYIEEITGKTAIIKYETKQKGDVIHTSADINKAKKHLNFVPKVGLKEGLTSEIEWMKKKENYNAAYWSNAHKK
ncbi:UDP-glucose 4-epimerase [candidate division WOR-1 bacterium DG_54_3]|uniref:UDP-glucose 4-epimerase n=1 Tax=candidate division WOR-1 bacterium DG_54_3 TaxID=1703775 RepID=A0A0S7XKX5_UNCSA|nr:MAG: UDP-glucose 4-epimerase [candidate division WOR-1 bacterium DG_54_3]